MATEPRTTLYSGQNGVARLSTYKRGGVLVSVVTAAQRYDSGGPHGFELHAMFHPGIFGLNVRVGQVACKVATQKALDRAHADALATAGRLVAARIGDLRSPPANAQLRPAVPYDPAASEEVHPAVLKGLEELAAAAPENGGAL